MPSWLGSGRSANRMTRTFDKWEEYGRDVQSIIAAHRGQLLAVQCELRHADPEPRPTLAQDVKDVVERLLQIQEALGLPSNALDPQVA